MLLAILGVLLIGTGVMGLRVMAQRSASLAALREIEARQDPRKLFDERIASRVQELVANGLADERDDRLEVTRFGRRIALATRLLRRVTGVRHGSLMTGQGSHSRPSASTVSG